MSGLDIVFIVLAYAAIFAAGVLAGYHFGGRR